MATISKQVFNTAEIQEIDADPRINSTTAPLGSLGLSVTNGRLYHKTDTGATDWKVLRRPREEFEDFNFPTLGANNNRYSVIGTVSNGGSAAIEGANTSNQHCGILTLSGGNNNSLTSSSMMDFFSGVNRISLGNNRFVFEMRVKVPILSSSNPSYQVGIGIADGAGGANGLYYLYTHGVNGGRWQCNSSSASTTSSFDSGVSVAANVWYKLRIEVASDLSSAEFYIDENCIAVLTTNIPTAALRPLAIISKLTNNQASRDLVIDYVHWRAI